MILRRTQEMVSGDLSAALARQPSTDNTVVSLHTQVADYTVDGERFALLAAWGGRQEVTLESRRIAVDDDTWLFHLQRHEVSQWLREAIKDEELAGRAELAEPAAPGMHPERETKA